MAYRLSLADDVATAARAVAREQLSGALAQVQRAARATHDSPASAASRAPATPREDAADAVHAARKHLKKTRALLRLLRPALGQAAYRRENAALREIAGELSATRDADVLVATVAALARRGAGRLPASDFDAVGAALAAEAAAGRAAEGPDLVALAARLRDALARVDAWPLEQATWADVLAGAVRQYRRGRDAFAAARAQPSAELLHEWRKRAKDLWYHHRLLRDAFAPVVGGYADAAHELTERLGDDHDLAVLRARLRRGLPLPAGAAVDLDALLAVVDERRGALERAAGELGERLYAEPRRAFARRLTGWVDAAVAEAARAQPA